jgi:type IV secretory pathway VirB2 component (pilin)
MGNGQKTGNATQSLSKEGKALATIAALVFFLGFASPANAALKDVICDILYIVQGGLGSAVATMGVLAVCFGAALGKSSWGLAITVTIGINLIFLAHEYADYFGISSPC